MQTQKLFQPVKKKKKEARVFFFSRKKNVTTVFVFLSPYSLWCKGVALAESERSKLSKAKTILQQWKIIRENKTRKN